MAKYIRKITVALILSLAICTASASRSRFLARQEVAEDIPVKTPYPPAGNKPVVAFDLPTDAKLEVPEKTYLPSVGELAETYGPPEVSLKEDAEELANDESEHQEEVQPEEVQAENPQAEKIESADGTNGAVVVDEADQFEAEQDEAGIQKVVNVNPLPERIVLANRNGRKSEKLQAAVAPQPIVGQAIFVVGSNGLLYRLFY